MRSMSELLNNREINREKTEKLQTLILKLHHGEDPEVVKEAFRKEFGSVKSSEIIAMEQELVDNGMDVEEIQRLCDIHADIFDGSIEEIHALPKEMEMEGHPVQVLKNENRALEALLIKIDADLDTKEPRVRAEVLNHINDLFDIDKHYERKELCFFPLMEKYGFDAPPKVMWGVDDEIRQDLKAFRDLAVQQSDGTRRAFEALRKRMEDMIFKEEMILLPMIQDYFTEDEWLKIAEDSREIGYCLVVPSRRWVPRRVNFVEAFRDEKEANQKLIHFSVGYLKMEELEAVMNVLPLDMTFIDHEDTVKYVSQGPKRIFARPKSVIGRKVQNCHPPRSLHVINEMLDDFRSGRRDSEDFWIKMGPKMVHISYYAVRSELGDYMGTLEVSHDIQYYRDLDGEKRLRDNDIK